MKTQQHIDSGLADSAFDFLEKAILETTTKEGKHYKFAVLDLFTAVELMLKERLVQEHWTFVFQDLDQATENRYHTGDFKSVDFASSLKRLNNISSVKFPDDHTKHLESLKKLRNRVQHFHAPITADIAIPHLANVTNVLLRFVESQLPKVLYAKRDQIKEIYIAISSFEEYIRIRMKAIKGKLTKYVELVSCPQCEQTTLGLGLENPHCLFCNYTNNPWDAMVDAIGDAIVGVCNKCGGNMGVYDHIDGGEVGVCFCCGYSG
jgi:hypothetical protein